MVAEARSKRDGKSVEILGHYNPNDKPPTTQIDTKRLSYWLEKGAVPTNTVKKILKI